MRDVIRLATEFIDIPSVSGEEQCFAERVAVECERMGCVVTRQEAASSRFNLYASKTRSPRVIFCSHLDTVPPFFGARLQKGILYGRGACDAKGIIAAQLAAGKKLFDEGVEAIAFFYLVGEEVDHIGARKAVELGIKAPYLVIGEPTELKMAQGSKGIVKCSIRTVGRKAHSAYPERGESAIFKLLDLLNDLRQLSWPTAGSLGETTWNIGLIQGGVAANVIPDEASAQLLFRTVTSSHEVLKIIERSVGKRGKIELHAINDPMHMHTLPGFETTVVAYNTDAPYLTLLGKPILFGPGSILNAHTDEEKIPVADLERGVEEYCRIARTLLKRQSNSRHRQRWSDP